MHPNITKSILTPI